MFIRRCHLHGLHYISYGLLFVTSFPLLFSLSAFLTIYVIFRFATSTHSLFICSSSLDSSGAGLSMHQQQLVDPNRLYGLPLFDHEIDDDLVEPASRVISVILNATVCASTTSSTSAYRRALDDDTASHYERLSWALSAGDFEEFVCALGAYVAGATTLSDIDARTMKRVLRHPDVALKVIDDFESYCDGQPVWDTDHKMQQSWEAFKKVKQQDEKKRRGQREAALSEAHGVVRDILVRSFVERSAIVKRKVATVHQKGMNEIFWMLAHIQSHARTHALVGTHAQHHDMKFVP